MYQKLITLFINIVADIYIVKSIYFNEVNNLNFILGNIVLFMSILYIAFNIYLFIKAKFTKMDENDPRVQLINEVLQEIEEEKRQKKEK